MKTENTQNPDQNYAKELVETSNDKNAEMSTSSDESETKKSEKPQAEIN